MKYYYLSLIYLLSFTPSIAQDSLLSFESVITKEILKKHVYTLADDKFGGRESRSIGEKMAAQYIETAFKKMGVQPAVGDSSFFQPFYLQSEYDEATVFIKIKKRKLYSWREYFVAHPFKMEKADYPIYFVGYGIETPAYSDYKNVEIKDKIAVLLVGSPESPQNDINNPIWSNYAKMRNAYEKGARGVIFIYHDNEDYKQARARVMLKSQFGYAQLVNYNRNNPSNFGVFYCSPFVTKRLLNVPYKAINQVAYEKYTNQKLINIENTVQIERRLIPEKSMNVIGKIEGENKEECIILTAHYDHLGKRGGLIYNGADDNASGTAALLNVAAALSAANKAGYKPKRTVIFLACSSEELGLIGSEYYTLSPVFPLDKTVININMDMVGKAFKGEKFRLQTIVSDLDIADFHNNYKKLTSPNIKIVYTKEMFNRSDHYNFYKMGVPFIYYNTGLHNAYHKPSDDANKINYEGLRDIARLIFKMTCWTAEHLELRKAKD